MFRLRRRKQEAYWYLSDDSLDSHDDCSLPGQISFKSQMATLPTSPSSADVTASAISEDEAMVGPQSRISLEEVLTLQTTFTSWPASIWEINFDDADGEIVFDYEGMSDDDPTSACSSKKSVGTLDTEEDTMPSSCSSPNFLNTWELEDLDLSAIVDESFEEEEEPDVPDSLNMLDLILCDGAFLGPAADLQDHEKLDAGSCDEASSSNSSDTSGDSNYFLIEESLDTIESGHQQLPCIGPHQPKHRKRLRFADEEGEIMETVHLVDCSDDGDPTHRRILILLLLPKQKKFEFIHADYSTESHLTISALLKQLPSMASDPLIRKQKYGRLCRAAGGSELINALSIQSYDLSPDEVLVGVLKGYTGKVMYDMAKSLVENENILRAVKRTNRVAHTLHSFDCTDQHAAAAGATIAGEENDQEDPAQCHSANEMDTHMGRVLEINLPLAFGQDRDQILHHQEYASAELCESPLQPVGFHDTHDSRFEDETALLANDTQESIPPSSTSMPQHIYEKGEVPLPPKTASSDPPDASERIHENRKQQRRTGLFGTKVFHREPSPMTSQTSKHSGEATFFGRKVFQYKASPPRTPPPSSQGGEAALFGKRVFQRKSSPRSAVQPTTSQSQEASSNHGVKPRWTMSRFGMKRWDKRKPSIETRRNEGVNSFKQ